MSHSSTHARPFQQHADAHEHIDPILRLKLMVTVFGDVQEISSTEKQIDSMIAYFQSDIALPAAAAATATGAALALATKRKEHAAVLLTTLVDCIEQMPVKASLYATFIALLHCKQVCPDFVAQVVATLSQRLQSHADGYSPHERAKAKHIVRFFALLFQTSVISPLDFFRLLEVFITAAEALCTKAATREYADTLAHIVISCLPWCLAALSSAPSSPTIISRLRTYMQARTPQSVPIASAFKPQQQQSSSSSSSSSLDMITWSWQTVDALLQQQQQQPQQEPLPLSLVKPYMHYSASLSASAAPSFVGIPAPLLVINTALTPAAITRFQIGDDMVRSYHHTMLFSSSSTISTTTNVRDIDRWIVYDYFKGSVPFFAGGVKEFLLQFAAAASTTVQKPKPFNYEGYLVQSILCELLATASGQLQAVGVNDLFFSSLLIHMMESKPTAAPHLALAFNAIYNNIHRVEAAGLHRLAHFFAHYLSNFAFDWVWSPDWEDATTFQSIDATPSLIGKHGFVLELLHACTTISYYDEIVDCVPASFQALLKQWYRPPLPSPTFDFSKAKDAAPKAHENPHPPPPPPLAAAEPASSSALPVAPFDIIIGDDEKPPEEEAATAATATIGGPAAEEETGSKSAEKLDLSVFAVRESLAFELFHRIRTKKEDQQAVLDWFKTAVWSADDVDVAVQVVMQVVLQQGSKTITHLTKAIASHLKLLRYVTTLSQDAQFSRRCILMQTLSFWRDSRKFQSLVVEALLLRDIVDFRNVVDIVADMAEHLPLLGSSSPSPSPSSSSSSPLPKYPPGVYLSIGYPFELVVTALTHSRQFTPATLASNLAYLLLKFSYILPSSSSSSSSRERDWRNEIVRSWVAEFARSYCHHLPAAVAHLRDEHGFNVAGPNVNDVYAQIYEYADYYK